MRKDITAAKTKKGNYLLVGELKNPTDYFFGNRCLENVYRVLGDDKYGYVYHFVNAEGKRQKTVNPLWHDSAKKPKKPKVYSAGERVKIRGSYGSGFIRYYDAYGFYRVRLDSGVESSHHVNSFC